MTMPTREPWPPRPIRHTGGLHYGWIIVGILVVVQVIGSAISQSAGVIVAPLRDPHGDAGGRALCSGRRVAGRAVWGPVPHAGRGPAIRGEYGLVGPGPAAL